MSIHPLIVKSRPLDVHLISTYPQVQAVMQSLLAELESGGYLGRAPRKKILKHLKVVVLDLYVLSTTPWVEFVSYSRKASSYSSGRRLGQLYLRYRAMVRAVDGLVGLGYVRSFKGFYDRKRKTGYQSRMQATDKLLRLIDKNHVTLTMIEREDGPLIILRDKNKKNIGFEETVGIGRINAVFCEV